MTAPDVPCLLKALGPQREAVNGGLRLVARAGCVDRRPGCRPNLSAAGGSHVADVGLRKLLEAKDCFVRAALDN